MKIHLVRLLGCLVLFGGTLALFLEQNNRLTQLRMELPQLQNELAAKREKEATLRYEIELRESPRELLKAAERPEFQHLTSPRRDEVVVL